VQYGTNDDESSATPGISFQTSNHKRLLVFFLELEVAIDLSVE
jgi:hypothetical protein